MKDVIVIGGGVIGALVAAELVCARADLKVELLDMAHAPTGASGYAGAIDGPYSWSSRHADLQAASWSWHEENRWQLPRERYRKPLTLYWLGRARDKEQLADVVRADSSPAPLPRGYEATTCLSTRAYVVDPLALVELALDHARRQGLSLNRGVRMISVRREPDHAHLTCSDRVERRCRHVVLAMGPWVARLGTREFRPAGWRGLRVKRVHGLRVLAPRFADRTIGWADPDRGLFLFPRHAGSEWTMSIKHAVWDVDPDVPQPPDTALLDRARPLLDAAFGPAGWLVTRWPTFADTYTPNRMPVVATVAGGLGTVVSGTHGSGVRLAPALAGQAATLAQRALDHRADPTTEPALA